MVARVAARHGLEVKKILSSGALLKASRQALESLGTDDELGAVSGNATVRSHMAMTPALTGAQSAWSGDIESLGAVDGRGGAGGTRPRSKSCWMRPASGGTCANAMPA